MSTRLHVLKNWGQGKIETWALGNGLKTYSQLFLCIDHKFL
jgi:hypothetical protein